MAENGLFSPAARHISFKSAVFRSNDLPSETVQYKFNVIVLENYLPLDHGVNMNVREAINFGLTE